MAKTRTWPMRFSDAGRAEINKFLDNPKTGRDILWNAKEKFYHRGPGDIGIWNEQKEWRKAVEKLPNKATILDLGAHIGMFPHYVRDWNEDGDYSFICVEPDPNNLRVLEKNLTPADEIHDAAVAMEDGKSHLWLGKTYPAANSVRPVRGRDKIEIKTKSFRRFLDKNPLMIKCDIEGAEYLLDWTLLPNSVELLAFEFHFFADTDERSFKALWDDLLLLGFYTLKEPKVNRFRKVTTGIFAR